MYKMKFQVIISLSVVVALSSALTTKRIRAPLLEVDVKAKVKDSYIVIVNEDLSDDAFEFHKKKVRDTLTMKGNSSKINHEYHIGKNFRGYSIQADVEMMETIRTMAGVKYVEENQVAHAFDCVEQEDAEWGLFRSSNCDPDDEDSIYKYDDDYNGDGVEAFIIDTGIMTDHEDFGGRAQFGYSCVSGESDDDLNGHGTHVAGTVISDTYGIAKGATATAVKVLNGGGSGTYDCVIAGVNWVANNGGGSSKKSVANMSLGGGYSAAVNTAVDTAVTDAGVIFAVAAGNENQNACNVSPASAEYAITVGSVDNLLWNGNQFRRSYFSNYGDCVDIFAPGAGIQSTWIGSDKTSTATLSGTSMASPHVAGVIAKIMTPGKEEFKDVLTALVLDSCKDMIDDAKTSPDLLLHNNYCD